MAFLDKTKTCAILGIVAVILLGVIVYKLNKKDDAASNSTDIEDEPAGAADEE